MSMLRPLMQEKEDEQCDLMKNHKVDHKFSSRNKTNKSSGIERNSTINYCCRQFTRRKLAPKLQIVEQTNRQGAKMIKFIRSGFGLNSSNSSGLILMTLMIIACVTSQLSYVRCQEFEDLNKNLNLNTQREGPNFNAANAPTSFGQQQQQQPSRQQQFTQFAPNIQQQQQQTEQTFAPPTTSNSRSGSFARPVLSNRFAQQQQQQQQASASSSAASSQAGSSNIESIMKNALNRAAKLDSIESRQDLGTAGANRANEQVQASEVLTSQSRAGVASQAASSQVTPVAATSVLSRSGELSESAAAAAASRQPAEEAGDKQTTLALGSQQTNGGGGELGANQHETVYSDQRFANLFARRGAGKKAKFTPTEQVKAKPTLPSFIKSLPDPKQFTSNPLEGPPERPIAPASSNLISARLQQQQQQNQNQQQNRTPKKTPSVANAGSLNNNNNNKRGQVGAGQKPTATAASTNSKALNGKLAASGAQGAGNSATATAVAAGAGKPSGSLSNNPFSKQQANQSDPANVIAMARRRLLANNALQQKQQQAASQ